MGNKKPSQNCKGLMNQPKTNYESAKVRNYFYYSMSAQHIFYKRSK